MNEYYNRQLYENEVSMSKYNGFNSPSRDMYREEETVVSSQYSRWLPREQDRTIEEDYKMLRKSYDRLREENVTMKRTLNSPERNVSNVSYYSSQKERSDMVDK